MAPLIHWRRTLAPTLNPRFVGDIPLAEHIKERLDRLTEENTHLAASKAAILREVADILEAEKNAEPPFVDRLHPGNCWKHGMARAVKVLRMRADDIDPARTTADV